MGGTLLPEGSILGRSLPQLACTVTSNIEIGELEEEIRRSEDNIKRLKKEYCALKYASGESNGIRWKEMFTQKWGKFEMDKKSRKGCSLDERRSALKLAIESRAERKKELFARRAALYAANRVPAEVLEQIFVCCLPNANFGRLGVSHPPLILCQVSRLWRQVAISTRALWCTLSIRISDRCGWGEFLDLCLLRSGDLPLTLEIEWRNSKDMSEKVAANLRKSAPRWRRLRLTSSEDSRGIGRVLENEMPLLADLEIDGRGWDGELSVSSMPSLQSLALGAKIDPVEMVLPWHRLVSFKSEYAVTLAEAMSILHKLDQVVSCDMRIRSFHGDETCGPVLVLPELRRLSLTNCGEENLDGVFDSLAVPRLAELNITTVKNKGVPWSNHNLLSMILRTSVRPVRLKRLTISGFECGEKTIKKIVLNVPDLEEFHVWRAGVDFVGADWLELMKTCGVEGISGYVRTILPKNRVSGYLSKQCVKDSL